MRGFCMRFVEERDFSFRTRWFIFFFMGYTGWGYDLGLWYRIFFYLEENRIGEKRSVWKELLGGWVMCSFFKERFKFRFFRFSRFS